MRSVADERSQSIQIGAVLLFAILIILFALWQAFLVPNQNENVELDHYEGVADDMTNVRSAIFEARTTGNTQSETLKLGVEYPNRIVARNPPPATGRLQAGEQRDLSIGDPDGSGRNIAGNFTGVGSADEVFTQLISYTPSYNEFSSAGSIWHEHGVLYRDFRTTPGEDRVFVQNRGQYLINNESGEREARLVPIQGEYDEEGIERVSIDPEPGILETEEVENVNITVPTRLSESRWESLLEGELPPGKVYVDEAAEQLTLELDGVWEIQYAPVGVAGTPPSGERGEAQNEINPASPGDVRFVEVASSSGGSLSLEFNNSADESANWTEARINFYKTTGGGGGNTPTDADINKQGEDTSATLDVKGPFETLDPEIEIRPSSDVGNEIVILDFGSSVSGQDWFVMSVVFDTGETGTYFIDP